ncbi:methylcrotonoyl-CoA carboxylase subunit alpha, mitochondrial [Monomorium pharaonis]|uniref:methylcrotonoyl-CoA carboxylase subunit alpha, mitochondrial n=1 Tax=Monomorium pharaonis TaxID=307658 RepID=UPI00063FCC1D|nr:methylcrotonoyl-CoA carboxylase subunit alpha, mitochondrial [Monomorium pharaonis]XP_028050829.1 methylcrotonoyl-CoA carboxylase subunit alpha, mitochondrial [Monomorium pharaonis]XP_036145988.1 methylcrotonoyl-CoA carboxylase subunit alpha, mitochondrial [Monomorium pharaonis]
MFYFGKLKSVLHKNPLTLYIRDSHQSASQIDRINKILIANRGEIACRVIKTARRLGVRTVAIYSEADRNSMHVEQADEAYCIGPAQSSQSYLRQDKIISVVKQAKCQAVHPGYGFLSENTEFAELCQKENIIFIGPPASAIRDMGIKNISKAIMTKAGVPIIEGYHGEDQTNETLLAEARKIGFPLMIKAVRGGGGKGMRIAHMESDFIEALESARTESEKAFGDSAVLLEKYVAEPRHVEVQIFADKHGNAIYLFERDCSVQRRHQKVIEEAPAPGISQQLRQKLGEAAVRAAKAVRYVGAGTVEFIMDRNDHSFHFMEMNTRLQVEHPVTEAITGLDLVEWQLRVASGEELPLKQEQINLNGHAFEARIYAENPRNGFLPGAGRLLYLKSPEPADNVRVETGVRQNDEVSVHYDPMIAKLVVWGKDRCEALNVLISKLGEYNIAGLDTNIEFIKDLCAHPKFQNGEVHTGFIEENFEQLFPKIHSSNKILMQGTLASILYEDIESLSTSLETKDPFTPFAMETGLRLNHVLNRTFLFDVEKKSNTVEVKYTEPDVYFMRVNKLGHWRKVTGTLKKTKDGALELYAEIDGIVAKARTVKLNNKLHIFTKDREWQLIIPIPKFVSAIMSQVEQNPYRALSPMPGLVDKIFVNKGDAVKKGDSLLVIVAMKMEHIIKASIDGMVEDVLCCTGDNVAKNKPLVKLTDCRT